MRDHGPRPLDAVLRSARAHRDRSPSFPGGRRPLLGLRVPSSLQALRPPPGFLRRCTSDRRPTSLHDGSRLDPPPTVPRGQRADPPGRRRRLRRCRTGRPDPSSRRPPGPSGTRTGTHVVPGSLTGQPWFPVPTDGRQARGARDDRAAIRCGLRAGDAGRRRPDVDDVLVDDASSAPPPDGGRFPEAHGRRPPRLFVFSGALFRNPVRAPVGHARNAGVSAPPQNRGRTTR
jgi:hypothetical protein